MTTRAPAALADRILVSFLNIVSSGLLRFGPLGLRMFLLRTALRLVWRLRPRLFWPPLQPLPPRNEDATAPEYW